MDMDLFWLVLVSCVVICNSGTIFEETLIFNESDCYVNANSKNSERKLIHIKI